MFPWFWVWNPQVHWPLSGSVTQDINPELDWFFQAIPQQAGVAAIEKAIFQQYSYGKQIGILMEAMKPLIDQYKADKSIDLLSESVTKFDALYDAVTETKEQAKNEKIAAAEQVLKTLQDIDPEAFKELLNKFQG